jgi:hypothetical protein
VNIEKVILILYGKVFALLGFPLMAWLWYQKGGFPFAVLIMGLPLIFGYVVPGIGTNILKRWGFRDSWVVGNYFIHHGFIYASGLSLGLYLGFVPSPPGDGWAIILNLFRTACIIGFMGWWHDLIAIRQGMMEVYNRAWKGGAAPEVIVTTYAPLCFSLFGAIYAAIATWGYDALVRQGNVAALWWLFPVGLTLMTLATAAPLLDKDY